MYTLNPAEFHIIFDTLTCTKIPSVRTCEQYRQFILHTVEELWI